VRAGLVFVALAALSTAMSIEPALSFFGSFDRGMGWLGIAAGGVLLVSAADLFVDEHRRERALTALLIGAIIPCGYFVLQRVGLDPITWNTSAAPGSSLASPTFLGGYLVVVAPFAMYRVATAARSASFAYASWLALLLVVCSVIVLTTIRGPILGLAVATVAFVMLASPRRRIGRAEIAAGGGILAVALVLAVAFTGASGAAGLQRFLNIARSGDSSVERLTAWQDALRIPLGDPARILLGFGPEAQQAVFEHGEATVRLTQNQQWDRAHDLVLDTWLTGGILGVLALVLAVGFAISSAWRARGDGGLLPAAVLAALVGHLVEVSFAFHTVVTGALFWLLLGLAASLTPRRWADDLARHAGHCPPRRWPLAIGVTSAVVLVPLLVTPAIADALYGQARRADYQSGAQLEELASHWAPWVEELPRAAALDWLQVANRRSDPMAQARAEADLREAAARAPMEPLPQLRLTRLYLTNNQLGAADLACRRAVELGPYRATIWDTCADVAAAEGRAESAPLSRARAEELRHPID
jgi:O-antigen ligase